MSQHGRKNKSTCSVWKTRVGSLWEGWSAGLIRVSCERFILTRNCSRCLSDSGVNSADMGMTSPARIMIALRKPSRQNRNAYFSPVTIHSFSSPPSSSSSSSPQCDGSPAVPCVCHIELPKQVDDRQGSAASWDVVNTLVLFYLHILSTNKKSIFFRFSTTQQHGVCKRHQQD